jgi:hypothetical protein
MDLTVEGRPHGAALGDRSRAVLDRDLEPRRVGGLGCDERAPMLDERRDHRRVEA